MTQQSLLAVFTSADATGPRVRRMARRAALTGLTVLALLLFARAGTGTGRLVALTSLFVVVATVWLHAQYVDDLTGRSWSPRPLIIVGLLLTGPAFIAFGYLADRRGWLPTGVVVLYFGVAFLMTWRRRETADREGPAGETQQARARRERLLRRQFRSRLLAFSAGALLILVGVALLADDSRGTRAPSVMIGIGLAVVCPPSLVLLSEIVIRRLIQATWGGKIAKVGLVMALIALAVTCGLTWWKVSGAFAVGGAVVALVVAGMVAGTHIDFVVIMLVAALLGVTSTPEPPPGRGLAVTTDNVDEADAKLHGRVLLALGDSYMSGEGASSFFDGTDHGTNTTDNQCRQAPSSWAVQLGRLSGFDSTVSLACQGALTQNLLAPASPSPTPSASPGAFAPGPGKRTRAPEPLPSPSFPVPGAAVQEGTGRSQIEKAIEIFKHREPPSLIVVSVGGNDAGFSGIGTMCLLPGKCSDKPEYWATAESFAQLQYELEAVYAQIDAAFPQSPVVVIPYPDPFYAGPGNKCGDLLLDEDEIAFVRTFLLGDPAESTPSPRPDRTFPPTPSPTAATLRAVPTVLPSPASSRTPAPARTPEPAVRTIGLDRTIRWTAQAHGFYYATDMMTALADEGIQLCNKDERDPGLHFIGLRSVKGVAEQRFNPQNWTHSSLHPNARGHAALLRAFDRWYQGVLADQAAADPNGRAATNHLLDKRVPNSPLGVSVSYGRSTCWINVKYTGIDESRGCRYLAKQWQTHQVGKALWQWGVATALTLDIFAGALLSIVLTALRRRRYQDAVEQDPHHSVFP